MEIQTKVNAQSKEAEERQAKVNAQFVEVATRSSRMDEQLSIMRKEMNITLSWVAGAMKVRSKSGSSERTMTDRGKVIVEGTLVLKTKEREEKLTGSHGGGSAVNAKKGKPEMPIYKGSSKCLFTKGKKVIIQMGGRIRRSCTFLLINYWKKTRGRRRGSLWKEEA